MKLFYITAAIVISVIFCSAGLAQQSPEEILKAIVKVQAIIPDDAVTAPILGTERSGSGVLIDSDGYVLTIGYLILEASTIEVVGPDDQVSDATFIGYEEGAWKGPEPRFITDR